MVYRQKFEKFLDDDERTKQKDLADKNLKNFLDDDERNEVNKIWQTKI